MGGEGGGGTVGPGEQIECGRAAVLTGGEGRPSGWWTRHLIELELPDDVPFFCLARRAGYSCALMEAGLPVAPALVVKTPSAMKPSP
jgi:hypothetical protein